MKLKRNFVQLTLIVSGAVAHLASAATLSAPGILVDGDGSQHFRKCSTCPDEPLLDSDERGGNNVAVPRLAAAQPIHFRGSPPAL